MLALECEYFFDEEKHMPHRSGIIIEFDHQQDINYAVIKASDNSIHIVNTMNIKLKNTSSIFGRKCKYEGKASDTTSEQNKIFYWIGWFAEGCELRAILEDENGKVHDVLARHIQFLDRIKDYDSLKLMKLSRMNFISSNQ